MQMALTTSRQKKNCIMPKMSSALVSMRLARRGKGMDHRGDGADAVEGVEGVHRLRRVGHGDGHAVAPADAKGPQRLGRGLYAGEEGAVVRLFAHELIGDIVGIAPRGVLDHLVHGLFRVVDGVRRVAVILQPRGFQRFHARDLLSPGLKLQTQMGILCIQTRLCYHKNTNLSTSVTLQYDEKCADMHSGPSARVECKRAL